MHLCYVLGDNSCTDHPNFKDKYGTTCEKTRNYGNCKDGNPAKVSKQRLMNDANIDGVSALDACCVCGGGKKGCQNMNVQIFL